MYNNYNLCCVFVKDATFLYTKYKNVCFPQQNTLFMFPQTMRWRRWKQNPKKYLCTTKIKYTSTFVLTGLVMEFLLYNSPRCDKERLSKGTEPDLAFVLWDKKQALSPQTDCLESNKPTPCFLNDVQGHHGDLLLCVNLWCCCRYCCCSFSALRWPLQMPGCWSTSLYQSGNSEVYSQFLLLFSHEQCNHGACWAWEVYVI